MISFDAVKWEVESRDSNGNARVSIGILKISEDKMAPIKLFRLLFNIIRTITSPINSNGLRKKNGSTYRGDFARLGEAAVGKHHQ